MKLKYRLKEIVLVEGNLAQTCAQIDNNSTSFATTLIKWFLVTRSIKRASTEGQESNSSNSPDESDTLAMTDGVVLGETAALACARLSDSIAGMY